MENFKCICGKEFNNKLSLGGHKTSCKIYQEEKQKQLSILQENEINYQYICNCGKRFKTQSSLNSHARWCEQYQKKDFSSKYFNKELKIFRCECGFETNKGNSINGHFSRCNIHRAAIGKESAPIYKNLKISQYNFKNLDKEQLLKICYKGIESQRKMYKTGELVGWCKGLTAETDERIAKIVQTQKRNGITGGYRENSGICKHGKYNGIHCDSTWELAYILYCNDNNIPIKRCDKVFDYYDNEGNKHRYYPDFIINENEIIEIKGRITDQWKLKLPIVEREHIKVLYKEDMKDILNYCYEKYGNDLTYLYDKK